MHDGNEKGAGEVFAVLLAEELGYERDRVEVSFDVFPSDDNVNCWVRTTVRIDGRRELDHHEMLAVQALLASFGLPGSTPVVASA